MLWSMMWPAQIFIVLLFSRNEVEMFTYSKMKWKLVLYFLLFFSLITLDSSIPWIDIIQANMTRKKNYIIYFSLYYTVSFFGMVFWVSIFLHRPGPCIKANTRRAGIELIPQCGKPDSVVHLTRAPTSRRFLNATSWTSLNHTRSIELNRMSACQSWEVKKPK